MLFSLLILGSLLFVPIGFKLKNQIDLYQKANHNLSGILRVRTSINKAVEYKRLRDWRPCPSVIPSGTSKLAWMHGECNWSYFKSCPNILSEIEYTTNQLSKYAQGNDIDKAMILLYRLEELEQVRDTSIRMTNSLRKETEDLSERYLTKVNLLSDLRSQLDCLDLSHLIDTDPNIAGSINELYSLMSVRIHDSWTRRYYQGDYGWFDEMVKGEILINKAVTMYKDLEKRCKETKGASLGTLKS